MTTDRPKDFIRALVEEDLQAGKHNGRVATRFPPEPNGYLHIGHAKSICLNFGIAKEYGGTCNLRFDDTNPEKEEQEFVESIAADVRWLGFDYGATPLFGSDYFDRMFALAEGLIRNGKAYVDSLTEKQVREYRGSLSKPGQTSPDRDRPVAESLDLFRRMALGEFDEGSYVLRAKIDLASPNMKMRDPLLYRIKKTAHHRSGLEWSVYPMYDYAHPLEDAFERITHSICTLEFADNRELYDWVIRETKVDWVPRQYEFARLNLDYTVMSKRKLARLVNEGHVAGWDDPRLPTIAGMRRRGYTAKAIRDFCELIGVAKVNSTVDIGKLEFAVRDDLNQTAPRVMAVLNPRRVILTNVPHDKIEQLDAPYFPDDVARGTRKLPFTREILIEADDFQENPPADYKRLAPGRVVRLRHAYCIRCDGLVDGVIHATWLSERPLYEKIWGPIHWVSASKSAEAEVRLYDRLFLSPKPEAHEDFIKDLNPRSMQTLMQCRVEPSVLMDGEYNVAYQFERIGYFKRDSRWSAMGEHLIGTADHRLVFNRIVSLKNNYRPG